MNGDIGVTSQEWFTYLSDEKYLGRLFFGARIPITLRY
jgi:hypothetical protein